MNGSTTSNARHSRARLVVGLVTSLVLLLGLAEAYLRFFPPRDLHPYLGQQSPLTGNYRADPALGVTYQSFETFAVENARALKPWLPLHAPGEARPIWAMFGSSFVHMRGMLADTARKSAPDRAIFNLGKNEPVTVRMAQIRLLLEHGFKPERIVFQIMPLDFVGLAEHPLASYRVTPGGALSYQPRAPDGFLGDAVLSSRLALTAWSRMGFHKGDGMRWRKGQAVDPGVVIDAQRLFEELARVTKEQRVPVTVLLIPSHEQIWHKVPCGFQDAFVPMLRELDLDVCDPREAFLGHQDRDGLFIPDKHFSPEGNRVLLAELRGHLDGVARGAPRSRPDASVEAIPTSARPSTKDGER